MNIRYSKYITPLCVSLDVLTICGLFFFYNYIVDDNSEITNSIVGGLINYYKVFILFIFSWYFITQKTRIYSLHRGTDFVTIIKRIALQTTLFGIVVFGVSGMKGGYLSNGPYALYFLLSLFVLALIYRTSFFLLIRSHRMRGGNARNVVFVDKNDNTHKLINLFEKYNIYGMKTEACFFGDEDLLSSRPYTKRYNAQELDKFVKDNNISIMFLSMSGRLENKLDEINEIVDRNHLRIIYIPKSSLDLSGGVGMDFFYGFPVLVTERLPLDLPINRILKRAFDILFSSIIIVTILSWLYPIIALLIKLDSKGNVLFIQKRNGLDGKPFGCYKFRTMRPSDDAGIKSTVKGDSRITKIGSFLRKTSLDEFPQFLNVFKGDMSIVGPRPHMVYQDEHYNSLLPKYCVRYYVKPGITGLSQVSGYRGEIRTDEDMENRIITDMYYVRKWSFPMDMLIIVKTVYYAIVGDKHAI